MPKTKKKQTVDPMAILDSAAKTPKKKKGKSKTPVIEITKDHTDDVEAVEQAINAWRDAKERKKDAEADIAIAEEVILPPAVKARREHIQNTGTYTTSVSVNGQIKMMHSKRYSDISVEHEDELREMFGDDKYDDYFVKHTQISFTEEAAMDREILMAIIKAIGEEKFRKVFDVVQTIKLLGHDGDVPPLVRDRDANEEVSELHDQAVQEGLIKPYKASFRV